MTSGIRAYFRAAAGTRNPCPVRGLSAGRHTTPSGHGPLIAPRYLGSLRGSLRMSHLCRRIQRSGFFAFFFFCFLPNLQWLECWKGGVANKCKA